MITVINDPFFYLNKALTSRLNGLQGTNALILGLILGGMMAVDMGGPINKAAFTFGLTVIEAGNFGPHTAAVMDGGMVPPLRIALATIFETEEAIPFAAADPVRVIVSCVVGSVLAGLLAMLAKVTLPVPQRWNFWDSCGQLSVSLPSHSFGCIACHSYHARVFGKAN